MTSSHPAPQFDIFAPTTRQNPYPLYAVLRSQAPVYHDPTRQVWVVSQVAEAAMVLKNDDAFSRA